MAQPKKPTKAKQNSTQKPAVQNTATKSIPFWDSGLAADFVPETYHPKHVDNRNGIQEPNPWDYLVINGNTLPGIVKNGEVDVKTEIKHKKNSTTGKDDNNPLSLSREPSKINITMKIWTRKQFDDTVAMLKDIYPAPGSATASNGTVDLRKLPVQSIYHPDLDFINISKIVLFAISPPKNSDVVGVKEYTIEALEKMTSNKEVVGIVKGGPPGPPPANIPGSSEASTPPGKAAVDTSVSQKQGQSDPNSYTPADPNIRFDRAP